MKRSLFIVNFLVLFVFLTITNVNAAECTTAELRELKNLAKKIEISYEPMENVDGNYYFAVNVYNMDKNFNLIVNDSLYVIYSSNNMLLGGFDQNTNLKISVYASNLTNCSSELLDKTTYKLPAYNKYYTRDECASNYEKDICKKWYNTANISEEKFKELISEKKTSTNEKNTFIDNVLSILKQYGLSALAVVIVVGLTVFIVIFIKNKKRTKIDL